MFIIVALEKLPEVVVDSREDAGRTYAVVNATSVNIRDFAQRANMELQALGVYIVHGFIFILSYVYWIPWYGTCLLRLKVTYYLHALRLDFVFIFILCNLYICMPFIMCSIMSSCFFCDLYVFLQVKVCQP